MRKEQDKTVIVIEPLAVNEQVQTKIEPRKKWTKAAHTLYNYQVLADF